MAVLMSMAEILVAWENVDGAAIMDDRENNYEKSGQGWPFWCPWSKLPLSAKCLMVQRSG
jgi:hypothetical protein